MRIKQLDGIRGVAILLVLAQHAFNLGMGWMGVDLFFVLSGFLITAILRKNRLSKSFWAPFYTKRATRILPAFFLCFVICALVLRGSEPHWRWLAYCFFGANVVQAFSPSSDGPLGPLWSLAVEEHFYFLWPFAVRYLDRSKLIGLTAAILLLEPALRAIATLQGMSLWEVYYLTPFRLDGLAAGSLLALLVENEATRNRLTAKTSTLLSLFVVTFGLCAVAIHSFRRPANSLVFNSIGYSLVVLISVSLIGHVYLNGHGVSARLLSAKSLMFLGVISYGLYLFHLAVIDVAKRLPMFQAHQKALLVGALASTVLFSWLSFRFFEQPITRWGHLRAERE